MNDVGRYMFKLSFSAADLCVFWFLEVAAGWYGRFGAMPPQSAPAYSPQEHVEAAAASQVNDRLTRPQTRRVRRRPFVGETNPGSKSFKATLYGSVFPELFTSANALASPSRRLRRIVSVASVAFHSRSKFSFSGDHSS